MGVNKYRDHVWVLPEDDANRQLANGFLLHPDLDSSCIDVRQASGGWARLLEDFADTHIANLRRYAQRHLILLIDFDERVEDRTSRFRDRFPEDVSERVYVLGTRNEPEPLRRSVGQSLERIGFALAEACVDGDPGLWNHELLRHNDAERGRLIAGVKHFLFR